MKLAYTIKERVLKSPYHLAIHLWNQLDDSIQICDYIYKFKRKVKLLDLHGMVSRM